MLSAVEDHAEDFCAGVFHLLLGSYGDLFPGLSGFNDQDHTIHFFCP